MNYYLISDTHFNHLKLEEWGGRSGDWQEQLWRGLAAIPDGEDEDILIHLGDICIGNDLEIHEKLRDTVPTGVRKILVKGNHDGKSHAWYYAHGWDLVSDAFALETLGHRILFSHRPRNPDTDNYTHNIHGHTHGNMHRSEEYVSFYSPSYHIDISPELVGYKPIRLDKLTTLIKKVKPYTA